jgi:hypothetical protein
MAGALECWSSRASTDEDMVEQVLMRTHDRSETSSSSTTEAASLQLSDQSSNLSLKDTISSSSAMQKKLQRLSRNVSEAIASLKNSLNLDSPRDSQVQLTSSQQGNCSGNKSERCRKVVWASVVRNLTQLYPGSQLPEKLVSNIRKHYDSLPLRFTFYCLLEIQSCFTLLNFCDWVLFDGHENGGKLDNDVILFFLDLHCLPI